MADEQMPSARDQNLEIAGEPLFVVSLERTGCAAER